MHKNMNMNNNNINKKINDKGTYYKKQNKNYRQKYQIAENAFVAIYVWLMK